MACPASMYVACCRCMSQRAGLGKRCHFVSFAADGALSIKEQQAKRTELAADAFSFSDHFPLGVRSER